MAGPCICLLLMCKHFNNSSCGKNIYFYFFYFFFVQHSVTPEGICQPTKGGYTMAISTFLETNFLIFFSQFYVKYIF